MKYFLPITIERLDIKWYGNLGTLTAVYDKKQVVFAQCKKDGTPRTDGKACFYHLWEIECLKYEYKIVNPSIPKRPEVAQNIICR